jgi:uncharacterized membrane protein
MTIGPIQICVVGFRQTAFRGEILTELNRLSDNDFIRIVDVLAVVKTEDGDIRALTETDLSANQAVEMGAVIGALLGLQEGKSATEGAVEGVIASANGNPLFDESQVFNLADELLPGEAAAIAVIEHRWMARIRDAVERLNGTFLLDTYVNTDDLLALGAEVARALELEAGVNAV